MAKAERAQINTPAEQQRILARLATPPKSPVQLDKATQEIFNDIIKYREFATWTPLDLRMAAILARDIKLLNALQTEVAAEGVFPKTRFPDPKQRPSPKHLECGRFAARILRAMSALGLTAGKNALRGIHQAKRNAAQHLAQTALDNAAGVSDLI